MGVRYDERYEPSARQLAEQKKQRKRLQRRRKIVSGIGATVLVIALGVGGAYAFVKGLDAEWEYQDRKMEAYRAEMMANQEPYISPEEKAIADREYVLEHYSPETIERLKTSIVEEYGVLIDAIVENETLRSNTDVKPLDANRLDTAIASYGTFRTECKEDQTNYEDASEQQRIDKTMSLYNTKESVLKDELREADQRLLYLTPGTEEYIKVQEELENIDHKLKVIKSATDVIGDRNLTIYFEQQRALEEGKQK